MINKYYVLDKMSSKGFQLGSYHPEHIYNTLSDHICSSCIEELPLSYKDFNSLDDIDKVNELLDTPCGAEFFLKSYEYFEDYVREMRELYL